MRRPLRGGVLLPKALLTRLEAARGGHLPLETGGFLIGRRRGPHLEITAATYQAAQDIATRSSFDRADRAHTAAAIEAWRKDKGLSDVVGDWHSHPSGPATPSSLDHRAWRALAQAKSAAVAGVILGDKVLSVHMIAVRGEPRVARLLLVDETDTDLVYAAGGTLAGGAWKARQTRP